MSDQADAAKRSPAVAIASCTLGILSIPALSFGPLAFFPAFFAVTAALAALRPRDHLWPLAVTGLVTGGSVAVFIAAASVSYLLEPLLH